MTASCSSVFLPVLSLSSDRQKYRRWYVMSEICTAQYCHQSRSRFFCFDEPHRTATHCLALLLILFEVSLKPRVAQNTTKKLGHEETYEPTEKILVFVWNLSRRTTLARFIINLRFFVFKQSAATAARLTNNSTLKYIFVAVFEKHSRLKCFCPVFGSAAFFSLPLLFGLFIFGIRKATASTTPLSTALVHKILFAD